VGQIKRKLTKTQNLRPKPNEKKNLPDRQKHFPSVSKVQAKFYENRDGFIFFTGKKKQSF
jgi:hypothetical protein